MPALDVRGLADDTIVVFTSDNGGERFSDTWPFTGIKTELLEGGLRVPTLICWPVRIPAGQVSEQVAITMDWFPTLLEATEVTPAGEYPPDGISLLPAMTGRRPRCQGGALLQVLNGRALVHRPQVRSIKVAGQRAQPLQGQSGQDRACRKMHNQSGLYGRAIVARSLVVRRLEQPRRKSIEMKSPPRGHRPSRARS